jgi:hypothetical protein
MTTKLTNLQHLPAVREAVHALFSDQGMNTPVEFTLPESDETGQPIDWSRVERILCPLQVPDSANANTSKLEAFCVGDADADIARIKKEIGEEDGEVAHQAIEELFLAIGG